MQLTLSRRRRGYTLHLIRHWHAPGIQHLVGQILYLLVLCLLFQSCELILQVLLVLVYTTCNDVVDVFVDSICLIKSVPGTNKSANPHISEYAETTEVRT